MQSDFINTFNPITTVHMKHKQSHVWRCSEPLSTYNLSERYGAILCDERFLNDIQSHSIPAFAINSTEDNKSFETLQQIWLFFKAHNVKKTDRILIIGGGIIHDTACLACALYYRGLTFDYVPTSLLSMIDVCIGGKTAVNAVGIKNAIGLILPSDNVIIDLNFIKTLSQRHIAEGFGELSKIAFLFGPDTFQTYLTLFNNLSDSFFENPSLHRDDYLKFIELGIKLKTKMVERDEDDTHHRKFLNFGHSIGHAIEAASHYNIPHGLAICMGMLVKIKYMPVEKNNALQIQCERLENHLNTLLKKFNVIPLLKAELPNLQWDIFYAALVSDKKNNKTSMQHVIPTPAYTTPDQQDIFQVKLENFPVDDAFQNTIHTLFTKIISF